MIEVDSSWTARCQASLNDVLDWSRARSYVGYSKFDVFNSPVMRALALRNRYLRLLLTAAWSRSPVNLRPWLGTERSRNPKGVALFALAHLRRYRGGGKQPELDQAVELLEWLHDNHIRGFCGKCWGYNHDWQSTHFYAPKNSPNIVVTGNVAYAFLEAYEVTNNPRYLDVARSVVEFLLKDLAVPMETPEMRSIGYVPNNQWGVLNINGLAATILIWVWQHTSEPHLKKEARRLTAFLVDKQNEHGAWHYAWPARTSNVRHDNYHTGNVLDWVLEYTIRSGDDSFHSNYVKGLTFYRDRLFLSNGAPKWRSDRVFPMDIHSAAQGIITLTKAAQALESRYIEDAFRTAMWAIENMQASEGYFYYQMGRFWTKTYTLERWCNAWMAYGLSSLLLGYGDIKKGPEQR